MDKQQFEKALLDEGYVCEKDSAYPSVIVFDKKDLKKVYRDIRAFCKDKGYDSSFAVRLYHEGIVTYPHEGGLPVPSESSYDETLDTEENESPLFDDMPAAEDTSFEVVGEVSGEPLVEAVTSDMPFKEPEKGRVKKASAKKEPLPLKEEMDVPGCEACMEEGKKEEPEAVAEKKEDASLVIPDMDAPMEQMSMFDMFGLMGGLGA